MPITVITGPPGAGKTTLAASLARLKHLGVHMVTDDYYHWIVAGPVPPWKPEANHQNATVIQAIAATAARYSAGGYDVIVDGIIGPWFLERFLAVAGVAPEDLGYVVLRPGRAVALHRALGRAGDRELVDPAPVAAMYDAFDNLGAYERNVVDSSDQDPAATLATVVTGLDAGFFALRTTHHADQQGLPRRYQVPTALHRRKGNPVATPVVHLVHGYLGAGKTTFANRLADQVSAVLLSQDEWYLRLHTDGTPTYFLDPVLSGRVNALLDTVWPNIVQRGVDVVLDFGFWSRARREATRDKARRLGVPSRLYWVRCDDAVAHQRIAARNNQPGTSFVLPDDAYEALHRRYEPLGHDEPYELVDTTDIGS